MIDQWEHDVRAVFAEDAAAAPVVADLAARARRRVWRQRTVRAAWVATPLAVVVAFATGALSFGGGPVDDPVVAPAKRVETADPLPEPSTDPDAITGSGPVHDAVDSVTLCQEYKPETLDDVDVAFDGTVTRIEPAPGYVVEGYVIPEVAVTFAVHEWFRGGSDPTFTVVMSPPDGGGMTTVMALSPYGVGTRILVSGGPYSAVAAPEQVIARTCGFTRYYDDATAAEWRKVFE